MGGGGGFPVWNSGAQKKNYHPLADLQLPVIVKQTEICY
jgi:hypothetical protein